MEQSEMRTAIDQTIAEAIAPLTAENFSGPVEQPVLRQFHESMRWNVTTILPVEVYVTDSTRKHTFFSTRHGGASAIDLELVPKIHAGLPTFNEMIQRRLAHIEKTRPQPEPVRLRLVPRIETA